MSRGPLYILLRECLFRSFAQFLIGLFVFLEWSHMSSLYILEIRPLSQVSLANIFSHIVDTLFSWLFSLSEQKLFILMNPHFFILSFISFALGDILMKTFLPEIPEIFLPIFSSKTSIVSQVFYPP